PMFALIMGSIELGVNMFAKARVEGVLREASRMAMTGNTEINGQNGEKIDAYVKQSLQITGGTEIEIVKSFYDSFDQVNQPEKKDRNTDEAPYCFEDVNGNQKWDANPRRDGLGSADDI